MMFRSLRLVYRRLPLAPEHKLGLKDFVYTNFGRWFARSLGYRAWLRARQPAPNLPKLAPVRPPSEREWHEIAAVRSASEAAAPIDGDPYVVVPVFGAPDETRSCLYSVLRADPSSTVVVVDDGSPDPELCETLSELAAHGLIELLRHPENLGFVAAANAGIARHPGRDVVLLNSDTRVFGDWLARLASVAHGSGEIGTVTPLSNNGQICSYPEWLSDNDMELELGDAELDALAAEANRGRWVEAPTGVGFCLYLRRDCLDRTGAFDVAFGRGYGEETDFCLRASGQGFRHAIAGEVFVRHIGGMSFGAEARRLRARAEAHVEQRHPGYGDRTRAYFESDPVAPLRTRLDLARCRRAVSHTAPRRTLLLVTHDQGGGVERHVEELRAGLEEEGVNVYLLRPSRLTSGWVELSHPRVRATRSTLQLAIEPGAGELVEALQVLGIDHVDVHHLAGFGAQATTWLRETLCKFGCAYDVTVHDYMPICPRVTLTGRDDSYCGEPELLACERCVSELGSRFGREPVGPWRFRWSELLAGARRVFCPSRDCAERIRRHFPDARVVVRPHREPDPGARAPSPRRAGPLRVAVIGAIGPEKGAEVVLGCARDAARRGLPIEFRIVGYTDRDAELVRTGRVALTGPYKESELRRLLAEQECSVALLPSLWPETWCYALTAALDLRLYTVSFDLGAQAERIADSGWGQQLPLSMWRAPSALNDALLAIHPLEPPPAPVRAALLPQGLVADHYEGFAP